MNRILLHLLVLVIPQTIFSQNVFEVAKFGTVQQARDILIKNERSFMAVDDRGFSPLILATYSGNDVVADFIIRYSDIDYVSPMGTALMAAVVKGNLELVRKLLHSNANPNLTDTNGVTALMFATQFKHRPIIDLLLSKNADKTIVDKNGRTAFEIATSTADDVIINLLK